MPTRYFDTNTEENTTTESSEPVQQQGTQPKKFPKKRTKSKRDELEDEEEPQWKKDFLNSRKKVDPFDGPAPIPEKRIQKYKRGKKSKPVSCHTFIYLVKFDYFNLIIERYWEFTE